MKRCGICSQVQGDYDDQYANFHDDCDEDNYNNDDGDDDDYGVDDDERGMLMLTLACPNFLSPAQGWDLKGLWAERLTRMMRSLMMTILMKLEKFQHFKGTKNGSKDWRLKM